MEERKKENRVGRAGSFYLSPSVAIDMATFVVDRRTVMVGSPNKIIKSIFSKLGHL